MRKLPAEAAKGAYLSALPIEHAEVSLRPSREVAAASYSSSAFRSLGASANTEDILVGSAQTRSSQAASLKEEVAKLEQRNPSKRKADESSDEELTIKLDPSPTKRPNLGSLGEGSDGTGTKPTTHSEALGVKLRRRLMRLKGAGSSAESGTQNSDACQPKDHVVMDRCGALHMSLQLQAIEDFLFRGKAMKSGSSQEAASSSRSTISAWPSLSRRPVINIYVTTSLRQPNEPWSSTGMSTLSPGVTPLAPPASPESLGQLPFKSRCHHKWDELDWTEELYMRMHTLALQQEDVESQLKRLLGS